MKEYVVGVKLLKKPERQVTIWFVNENNEITLYKHSNPGNYLQENKPRENYSTKSYKDLITTIIFEFIT